MLGTPGWREGHCERVKNAIREKKDKVARAENLKKYP
jgi:hypothetical protein